MSTTHPARIHTRGAARPIAGEFVLYWMQVTHRAHHNPALNYAVERANELGLPVVVYHGLRPDYPWASDRLHTFILESVADLCRDFSARGIQYGFYLQAHRRPGGRTDGANGEDSALRSPLVALADRAALVVTDYFPTFIVPRQTRALREKVEAPVIAVDSCGVIPLSLISREHLTARGFRTEVERLLPEFLHPIGDVEPTVRRTVELGFDATRPASGENAGKRGGAIPVATLVARCDIDHSVGLSPVIRGGPTAARARLNAFLSTGLARYAKERGDPNADASSRLSPYLHFGNISIQEVLLAVREQGPADQYLKFLDEAVVWRELAHNLCHHHPKHRTVAAIPDWARKELADHEADPRQLYAPDDLEQARTGDELWNAAQRSLLRDGELHNYVRMLWGKSVIGWTRDAASALTLLEHLNHKYALDGRDPSSYGGILWCFGKFDRPFYRRPIFGTVRYMSTKAARTKFDVDRYVQGYSNNVT